MSYKNQSRMPGVLLALLLLIVTAYVMLIFVAPHFLASYSQTGKPLPPILRVVLDIAHVIHKADILIIPLIVVAFTVALAWLIYSSVKLRRFKDQ